MAKGSIAQKVEELVLPVAQEQGLEIWDVRFEKEGADWFLKVLVERVEGLMDTDACEKFSRAIDPLLDKEDYISDSYYLEVGSPGIGRRLTRPEHYEVIKGQKVLAVLYGSDENGNREYSGILLEKTPEKLVLECNENKKIEIVAKTISYCKLCDDENLFNKK